MSYDASLIINTGIEDNVVVDMGNYTYNVGGMFKEAMGIRLGDLSGMLANDAIPIIEKGIQNMKNFSEIYRAMNPLNGWGNYEGALQYLENILFHCVQHPACTIKIN